MTGHVLKHCPAMQKFTAKLPIKKELFTTLAAQFEASARVCSQILPASAKLSIIFDKFSDRS